MSIVRSKAAQAPDKVYHLFLESTKQIDGLQPGATWCLALPVGSYQRSSLPYGSDLGSQGAPSLLQQSVDPLASSQPHSPGSSSSGSSSSSTSTTTDESSFEGLWGFYCSHFAGHQIMCNEALVEAILMTAICASAKSLIAIISGLCQAAKKLPSASSCIFIA